MQFRAEEQGLAIGRIYAQHDREIVHGLLKLSQVGIHLASQDVRVPFLVNPTRRFVRSEQGIERNEGLAPLTRGDLLLGRGRMQGDQSLLGDIEQGIGLERTLIVFRRFLRLFFPRIGIASSQLGPGAGLIKRQRAVEVGDCAIRILVEFGAGAFL